MRALIVLIWNGIGSLAALIVPIFDKAGVWRHISRGLRWAIHIILVIGAVIGLHYLNVYLKLGQLIPRTPSLADNWLPILFLLCYVLGWLAWALYRLLVPEDIESDFPDIDAAWNQAMDALHQSGLGLTDAPLFLVLGETVGGEGAFFKAAFPSAQRPLRVPGAPAGNAPLHAYATADAIWLTCAGASLTGEQVRRLTITGEGGPGVLPQTGGDADSSGYSTMAPGGQLQDVQVILSRARKEGRELTEPEQAQVRQLLGQEQSEHAAVVRSKRPPLLRETAVVDLCAARLAHLCRLIVRDRKPFCPINGILLLVPWAGTDTDDDAGQTAEVLRTDLTAVRALPEGPVPGLCPGVRPGEHPRLPRIPAARAGEGPSAPRWPALSAGPRGSRRRGAEDDRQRSAIHLRRDVPELGNTLLPPGRPRPGRHGHRHRGEHATVSGDVSAAGAATATEPYPDARPGLP